MRVGLVGLGIMGAAMAERLLATGHELFVHNRTREKAESFLQRRAQWAETPADAARESEVVLSVVSDPEAVAEISLREHGILSGLTETAVHADMSTVSPHAAGRVAARYRIAHRRFVQAPVLGSKRQIEQGELLVFGGGEPGDVAEAERAWHAFSRRTWRLETAEHAATLKLACNQMIANMILTLGQSMIFAQKGGVSPELLLEVLGDSALGCPMYASKGKTLLERQFAANFVVRHMLKDLHLAGEAARETGTPLPLTGFAREYFAAAEANGFGDEDYSAVVKVLELMARVELCP